MQYNHGQSDLLLQCHHRFSHASFATTVRTVKSLGLIDKLDKGARLFCMHCLLARPRRVASRKVGVSDHKNRIFSKFFIDCAGPFAPAAGTKNKCAMTVIDRYSGQNYTYCCQSTADVPELFKRFLTDIKLDLAKAGVQDIDIAIGKVIFQSDNASVLAGKLAVCHAFKGAEPEASPWSRIHTTAPGESGAGFRYNKGSRTEHAQSIGPGRQFLGDGVAMLLLRVQSPGQRQCATPLQPTSDGHWAVTCEILEVASVLRHRVHRHCARH